MVGSGFMVSGNECSVNGICMISAVVAIVVAEEVLVSWWWMVMVVVILINVVEVLVGVVC